MMLPNNEILQFFAKYIESELGIIYSEHNFFQLENRLEQIAKNLSLSSIEDLYKKAQSGIQGEFRQLLLDIATNNETSFFRDPILFTAFYEEVIPFFEKKGVSHLRIWSAASSSGQEALSLAILMEEYKEQFSSNLSYHILATDISEKILEKAKAATYTQLEVQRGLSPEILNKFFKKDHRGLWIACEEIRKNIQFQKLNLKSAFHFAEAFDVVFCRNILIYQNENGKKEILNKIQNVMSSDAILTLGSGESLLGLDLNLQMQKIQNAIFYKKKTA